MPYGRKNNETHKEYKKRVIDSKSDSFCGAKWYNATIWLGHGQTASCHHPPAHNINVKELKLNPSAIHNTPHKKLMRKYMQEGKRPKECEYCWKVEDIKKDNISDRVYKTEIYSDEDLQKAYDMPWDANVNLRTLEISFDRTCQFACSYCNPAFSTTWVKDIEKDGPYKNIQSDGRGHFIDTAPWSKPLEEGKNPYIDAFFKWWETDLHRTLEELRITGGEPLMSPGTWKLFDWFEENADKSNVRFAINSNLGGKQILIDRLIEKSHNIPNFQVFTSCEAFGKDAEFIRDGLDFEYWRKNIRRLITEGNLQQLNMMMTINALCLLSMDTFLDYLLELKKEFGPQYPMFTVNLLRFPSFQSPLTLPKEIKEERANCFQEWIEKNKDLANKDGWKYLQDFEIDQLQRLIDYLRGVDTPHMFTAERPKLLNDFKEFYLQYSKRRGFDFHKIFGYRKDFIEWFDNIELLTNTGMGKRSSGESVADYDDPNVKEPRGWNTTVDKLGKNQ
tara:strand:- start:22151 stop:23662 length:1512 start_codon:yes stop_codon:yes gene_type:complete